MDLANGIPALPSAGALGAIITLVIWLIRRGDSNLRSDIAQLRKQRDDALDARDKAETENTRIRDQLNHAETELVMYRRVFGVLEPDDGG